MIRPRRSWSIVFRVSAWYALITIALLALFGAFLYWSLKESLEVSARNTLADKISVMRQILSERRNDKEALEEEVQWESTERRRSVYYSRLLHNNGDLVIQSSGAQSLIPPLPLCPPPASEDRPIGDTQEFHPEAERTLMVSSAWVTGPGAGKGGGDHSQRFVYTLALDISTERNILNDYRNKLLLILVAGSVVSAVAGTYVARKGIRPIEEISAAADRITANVLGERVDSTAWARDLASFAAALHTM